MEDSAMLGSNTSAMADFREAVLRRCRFYWRKLRSCLPETKALNPGVRGRAPEKLQINTLPPRHIKLNFLI